jgi:membrane protease YdiL (CAAX protease family)
VTPPLSLPSRWLARLRQALTEEERGSRQATADTDASTLDWRVVVVLISTSALLTIQEYYSKRGYYVLHVMRAGDDPYTDEQHLRQLLYWAGVCFGTYFVIPALIVRGVFRQRLRDYGMTWRGAGKHAGLYVVMLAIMGPLVWWASAQPSFQQTYPFYRAATRDPSGFWLWTCAYAAQFFSLEFFFRGFMIHGLRRRFGVYSVIMMTIPYCMIHFGKPVLETLGAVVAGLVLGFLSLRSGSIMLGVFIHVSVALAMDLASLWRYGNLPF